MIKLMYLPFAISIVCLTAYTNSKCDMMIASLAATHGIQATIDRTVSEKKIDEFIESKFKAKDE